nr:hypothetical protein [Nonomuraea aurantiaca]
MRNPPRELALVIGAVAVLSAVFTVLAGIYVNFATDGQPQLNPAHILPAIVFACLAAALPPLGGFLQSRWANRTATATDPFTAHDLPTFKRLLKELRREARTPRFAELQARAARRELAFDRADLEKVTKQGTGWLNDVKGAEPVIRAFLLVHDLPDAAADRWLQSYRRLADPRPSRPARRKRLVIGTASPPPREPVRRAQTEHRRLRHPADPAGLRGRPARPALAGHHPPAGSRQLAGQLGERRLPGRHGRRGPDHVDLPRRRQPGVRLPAERPGRVHDHEHGHLPDRHRPTGPAAPVPRALLGLRRPALAFHLPLGVQPLALLGGPARRQRPVPATGARRAVAVPAPVHPRERPAVAHPRLAEPTQHAHPSRSGEPAQRASSRRPGGRPTMRGCPPPTACLS